MLTISIILIIVGICMCMDENVDYKNIATLRDEKSSQKARSGGKGTLNCCFFVLISAQTRRFVQKNEGKKLHENADVCMFLRWIEIFPSAFFCQFSLQVCSIN